jgi:hypothetical protein
LSKKNPDQKQPGEKEPGTFHYNPGNMSGKTIGTKKGAPQQSKPRRDAKEQNSVSNSKNPGPKASPVKRSLERSTTIQATCPEKQSAPKKTSTQTATRRKSKKADLIVRSGSLYVRSYWPKAAVLDDSWTPPAVTKTS